MAETLRELVVSLSLQSDNFSKNIQSVQQQIKEAESRFEAAGAGVENFARKTDGLKARASALTDKFRMQGQIVEQYAKAIAQAEAKLQKNMETQQATAGKLEAAKKAQSGLTQEIERAKVALDSAEKAYGKNSAVATNARETLEDLKEEHTAATVEVKKLEEQLALNSKTLQNNADDVTKLNTALNKAKAAEASTKAALEKTTHAIDTQKAHWDAAAKSLDKFGNTATAAGQKLTSAGQLLSVSVTAPLVALGGYAVKASIDAESAFADVRKTVDMTEEEFAALDETLKGMTTSKPALYADVASLAATGGQLGVLNDNLKMFTATMTDLGVATDLAGEEGASQLAKFSNITGMAQENFDRLGSTLVRLGNNTAATESGIMSMAMRLGAAGSQVGLSEAKILGFSAALSSVGIEAEAGGSAFSKALIGMQLAVETGENGLKDYARVSGMTAEEFQQAWKVDAAGAIQSFIIGLSKMDDEGISTIKTLNDMGFTEVRLRDTLMRATNASGLFSNALSMATDEWKQNTALTNEANARYATTESRLTMLKSKASLLATTYGDDLNGGLLELIDSADGWLDKLSDMDSAQRQTLMTTAAWLAALGPGVMLIGKMNTSIGAMSTGFGSLIKSSVEAGGGLKGLFAATGSLLGPAGIAALTAAVIYGAYKWIDYASGAKAAREATEAMLETSKNWKDTQSQTIYDTGNDPLERFGLSKAAFDGSQGELADWLSRLTDTWSDGKKETNEIVKQYVSEFSSGSDKIRDAIKSRKKSQEKFGVVDDKTTSDDLKKLDEYDRQVAALLKKRQNGKLTEEDQTTLDRLVRERIELQLKYTTGEGGSYESLEQAVEAEKARLKAEGSTPGADLYGDALTGAAQGYQAQVDAINKSYRDQYADVAAITDEKQREEALNALNAEHMQSLSAAQSEYNALVGKYAPEAFQSTEVQQAAQDMETLKKKLADFRKGKIDATALKEFTDTLDEGKLASYVALLEQMKASGLGDLDFGDGISVSDLLGGYETIADYLKDHAGTLTGLGEMLGAATDEANRVLVSLGFTPDSEGIKEQLESWEKDGIQVSVNGSVTTKITYDDFSGIEQSAIDAYFAANPGSKPSVTTNVGFQSGWEWQLKNAFDNGKLRVFDPKGVPVNVTPDVVGVIKATDILVEGFDEDGNITIDVIVTPKVGSPEGVQAAEYQLNERSAPLLPDYVIDTTMKKLGEIKNLQKEIDAARANGEASKAYDAEMELMSKLSMLDPDELASIGEYISQAMSALSSGELDAEGANTLKQQLNDMLAVVKAADQYHDTGNDISAGIANGMKSYGWTGDASTLASSIESAIRGSLQSQSPARKMIPVGKDIAAGVAKGVDDGAYQVKDAMVRMAKAALQAAKDELEIKSPSRVMRDQVGVMIPRGTVIGIEEEAARQQKAVQNAYRLLVQPALSGGMGSTTNDNRRNYTTNNEATVHVDKMIVQDKNDIRALAQEMSYVQRRALRARGAM